MRGKIGMAVAAQLLVAGAGAEQASPRGELAGVVAEVRPVEGTIRVKEGDGPEREIVVRSATEITVEGRAATMEDIHPGAEIRASLEQGDLAPVATRIDVGPGAAAPELAAPDGKRPGAEAEEAADGARRAAGEAGEPDE